MKFLKQDAHKLNQKIKQLEEVQAYLKYKEMILKDEKLQFLLKNIQDLQKEMKTSLKVGNKMKYEQCQKELENYRQQFNENPIIPNYLHYKNEVQNLIEMLSKIFYFE